MVKKRKSGSENIETVLESNRRRKQPHPVPAGRPQPENSADVDEQLRTENEELRQQVLELHEGKDQDDRSIRAAEWLARLAEENPDPVLQVSLDGVVRYRNPASFPLCRQWNPSDELLVPPAVQNLVQVAHARARVIRQEMAVGEHSYLITIAPAPAPAKYVNIYAGDITARKKAEEARRETENRLALALSSTRMGMYERNLITGEIRGTDQLARLLDLRPTTTTTTTTTLSRLYHYHDWAGRVHPEDWKRIETQLHRCLTERAPFEADYRIMQHDGGVRWVADRGVFQYDARERPTSIVGILVDVTERKRAEEMLKRSEEKYRALFDSMTEGFGLHEVILDADGKPCDFRFLEMNAAWERLTGVPRATALGKTMKQVWPELEAYWLETYGKVALTGEPVHYENYNTPLQRWYETFAYSPKQNQFALLFIDITERQQAEEALRESEEKYRRIVETATEAIVMADGEARTVFANARWSEIFGYSLEEARHLTHFDMVFPEDVAAMKARWEARKRGQEERYEFRMRRKDGSPVWVLIGVAPRFGPEGQFLGTLVMITDITEQKRAEEALRESERRLAAELHVTLRLRDLSARMIRGGDLQELYAQMLDTAVAVMESDCASIQMLQGDGGTRGNGSVLHLLAWRGFHPQSARFWETVRPDSSTSCGAALRSGTRRLIADVEECGLVAGTPDLEEFRRSGIRSVQSTPLISRSGRLLGMISTHWRQPHEPPAGALQLFDVLARQVADLIERKQDEEALRELNATLESKVAQRTAQLQHRARQLQKLTLEMSEAEDRERQRLAAILHDDLQQMIAAAKFHLSVMRNRVKDDASLAALGEQIDQMLKEAVEKSRGLSHELSPAALYGDFAEALDQLASQMQAKHGLTVQVHATGQVHLQSDAVKAFIYRTTQELLFNVVKHAQVKEAQVQVRRLGRYLCLTVSDRGRGFDPQELREAAGFGLLSIRERIELLGGRMKIRSAPGKGSTFFLVVPDGETPEETALSGVVT